MSPDANSPQPYSQIYSSESKCTVEAFDHVGVNKLWFTTPEFTADQIARLESIELATEANHQGWISEPDKGIWSWFEVVVLDNSSDPTPRTLPDGQPMILLSHKLEVGAEQTTQQAKRFTRSDKLFSWLQPSNVIGVRVCARFAGWRNDATKGFLTVNFSAAQRPTIGDGNGQVPFNQPSAGTEGYISFKNETRKDIKVRVTITKDSGSEIFYVINAGKTDKWKRASMQVAFVLRTDNYQTLTLAVEPGKTYTIGGDIQMPEPVQNTHSVTGTVSTFAIQGTATQSFSASFEVGSLGQRVAAFPATSSVALPLFDAEVTMSYAKDEDLTGRHTFTGVVGLGKFALKTDNDVTMVGKLTKGGPDYLLQFTGSGYWSLSK